MCLIFSIYPISDTGMHVQCHFNLAVICLDSTHCEHHLFIGLLLHLFLFLDTNITFPRCYKLCILHTKCCSCCQQMKRSWCIIYVVYYILFHFHDHENMFKLLDKYFLFKSRFIVGFFMFTAKTWFLILQLER